MILTVLAFAQSQDLFGFTRREVAVAPEDTPRGVLLRLQPGADLSHLRVALDCEFADWDLPLGSARELAILPPVSGG
jgi:molybdopterin converting factor small subunit